MSENNDNADTKKKSLIGLIVSILVILLVLAIIGFVIYTITKKDSGDAGEEGSEKGKKETEAPALMPKRHLKEEKEVSNLNPKHKSELKNANEVADMKTDMLVNMGNVH